MAVRVRVVGALVVLAAEAGSVTPGEELRSVVLIRNTGASADEFHVVVQGPASQWAEVSPNLLRLDAGEEGPAWVTFAPPRRARVEPGLQSYSVAVTCRSDPDFVAIEEGVVDIGGFRELGARLSPPGEPMRRLVPYTLTVANRGNDSAEVAVRAVATDEGLAFSIDPPAADIDPGEAQDFEIGVLRPRKLLRGGDARRFSLRIASEGADVAIIEAELPGDSALARDLRRSAIVLAIVLVIAVLAGQALLDRTTSGDATTVLGSEPPDSTEGTVTGETQHGGSTAVPPGAAALPPVGRLAFVRSYGDGKDIVVREPSGAETRLVSAGVEERRPSLSPDGARVAFVGTEIGKASRLCVIPTGGGSYFCLAPVGLDSSVAWSADGATLFYARDDVLRSVAVVAPPDEAPEEVSLGVRVAGNRFSMDPARSRVVTTVGAGLVVRSLSGGGDVTLAARGQPGNVAWSPDGRTVAYDDGNDVWLSEAAGGGTSVRMTQEATVEVEPAWSDDGGWLVFRSNASGGGDLYAMSKTPGARGIRLTTHEGADVTPSL